VASERWRTRYKSSPHHPRRRRFGVVARARIRDALHHCGDDAALGLGHRKFLAAVSVCLHRAGVGFGDERRNQGPPAHHAARHSRIGRGNRGDLYCWDVRGTGDFAGGTGRSEKRRFSGALARVYGAAGSDRGDFGRSARSTVAGIARVPFVVGIDRYLPAAFGKIHPRWKTPYISILVQAVISAIVLLVIQINETASSAYQILVDAATILYFIPFVYMYAAAIKLAYREDRAKNPHAVLIPGGLPGVWLAGGLGFAVVAAGIVLSLIPPGESTNKFLFEVKLVAGTLLSVLLGLILYYGGSRQKAARVAPASRRS
jgi:Amino acid permease